MTESSVVSRKTQEEDIPLQTIRPQSLSSFIGQKKSCANLKIFIQAAKSRRFPLDHVLFSGPPGLGKTTLSHLIALEMGAGFHTTSGPALPRAGELASLLTNLQPLDVLFIDEIHRLPIAVEEILYQALEDFKIDMTVGEGPYARPLKINLSPFTLVGATTRSGLLSRPLRDRFGISENLNFYPPEDMKIILKNAAKRLNIRITEEAAFMLAKRSRGTPRVGLRMLRRLVDFAYVAHKDVLETDIVISGLSSLGIDEEGLDELDRRYLQQIAENFKGGPVGVETLAAALFEEKRTLEDVVEPYLMQKGFLKRTPGGRVLSQKGADHLTLSLFNKRGEGTDGNP